MQGSLEGQRKPGAISIRLLIQAVVLLLCALCSTACRREHPSQAITGPQKPSDSPGFASGPGPILVGHPVRQSDLTESERNFGIAPKRGPGIVYQPDIVLMEHGDQAIRSFASNGLSWSFDANAPQVDQIQPGKIVFATSRAVGRVLALQRNGDQISAILGPVQLTDLVKQGKFAYDSPPILNSMVAVAAPDYPGAVNSTASQTPTPGAQSFLGKDPAVHQTVKYFVVSDTGQWTPMKTVARAAQPALLRTSFHPTRGVRNMQLGGVTLPPGLQPPPNVPNLSNIPAPPVTPNIPMIPLNGLQATPCVTCGGLGLEMYQEKNGLKVKIQIVFHLNHPRVIFECHVEDGSVEANLQLVGGAGVTVNMEAGATREFRANIAETGLVPVEITVPIGGIFLPLEVKLGQSIDFHSGMSAKTSVLRGAGGIDLDGEIMADYHQRTWTITPPQGKVTANLAGLVSGVSVGINSMEFAIDQRLLIGLGALGFATGPYVDLISSVTSLKQATIATTFLVPTPLCGQGTFQMTLGAGIGYSMPRVVASVINSFLGLFGVKPIPPWGSIIAIPKRKMLIDHRDELPEGCSGK